MSNVPAKLSTPSTPVPAPQLLHGIQSLSPYVDVKGVDDFSTPPSSPRKDVSESKHSKPARDSTALICARTKTAELPSEFLQYFGRIVSNSGISESIKRGLLSDIVSIIIKRSERDNAIANGRSNSGSSSSVGAVGSYYRNHNYNAATQLDATFSSTTQTFSSPTFTNLTALEVGTQPGQLSPGSTLVKFKKFSINLNMWVDPSNMSDFVATNPVNISKVNAVQYRVLVVRDRFGSIGPAPNLYEVASSVGAPPANFNTVMFWPNTTSALTASANTNASMIISYSDFTCPSRFEILHDSIHMVGKPVLVGIGTGGGSGGTWTGNKHLQVDLNVHDQESVFIANQGLGSVIPALTNAVYMLIWSNINTNAAAVGYLPVPRVEILTDSIFEDVLPAET